MRTGVGALALVLPLLGPAAAGGFTIDFEATSGFTLGEAPPAMYPTPWGDVSFGNAVVAEDPLGPGAQMLSPVPGAEYFWIHLPPGIFEPEFVLVNPAQEEMSIAYFDDGWSDCGGDPCNPGFGNDYGISVAAEFIGILVLTGEDAPHGSAGPRFYAGAHPNFDDSRFCDDTPEGCYYGWGVASVSWVPEPGVHFIQDCFCLCALEQESPALREEIVRPGMPAGVAADQGEIAELLAHGCGRREVIGRGEIPVALPGDHRVVSGMVVRVRDQRVEAHAPEELRRIPVRLRGDTAQLLGQRNV